MVNGVICIRHNKIYAFEYILGILDKFSFAGNIGVDSKQPWEDL